MFPHNKNFNLYFRKTGTSVKYEVLTCIVHAVKVKISKYWDKTKKHSKPEYAIYTTMHTVSLFYIYCDK